ncbi:hypothetical protein BLS_005908 [Venturia inaequalis]|uniref:Uncharacterized protein n=1 Tax=Venturia inaequalis TaxID=5025 RepID=A0A8H3UDU2_VENIN|nr:hypothetical protein BLS_005908 [Venturia inaequalis]
MSDELESSPPPRFVDDGEDAQWQGQTETETHRAERERAEHAKLVKMAVKHEEELQQKDEKIRKLEDKVKAIEAKVLDQMWEAEHAEDAQIPATREEAGVRELPGQKRRRKH